MFDNERVNGVVVWQVVPPTARVALDSVRATVPCVSLGLVSC